MNKQFKAIKSNPKGESVHDPDNMYMHDYYEKWRKRNVDALGTNELKEYKEDVITCQEMCDKAWSDYLATGIDPIAERASLESLVAASASSNRKKFSIKSYIDGAPIDQVPSSDLTALKKGDPSPEPLTQALPVEHIETVSFIKSKDTQVLNESQESKKSIINVDVRDFFLKGIS